MLPEQKGRAMWCMAAGVGRGRLTESVFPASCGEFCARLFQQLSQCVLLLSTIIGA